MIRKKKKNCFMWLLLLPEEGAAVIKHFAILSASPRRTMLPFKTRPSSTKFIRDHWFITHFRSKISNDFNKQNVQILNGYLLKSQVTFWNFIERSLFDIFPFTQIAKFLKIIKNCGITVEGVTRFKNELWL